MINHPVMLFYLLPLREKSSHDDPELCSGGVCRDTMIMFIFLVSVLLPNIPPLSSAETDVTLNVEEAPQEVRDQFDELPLLSKSVTPSDWCEVKL